MTGKQGEKYCIFLKCALNDWKTGPKSASS